MQAQHDDDVRVLWFGDSHTAADYMTDRVRRGLQERFGSGGPGFVRIGLANYRHAGLKVSRDGAWRIEPHPPARRSRQDDGVFGLGGLRAVGEASARARLELTGSERRGDAGEGALRAPLRRRARGLDRAQARGETRGRRGESGHSADPALHDRG